MSQSGSALTVISAIPKIPLGQWVQQSTDYFTTKLSDEFRFVSELLTNLVQYLIDLLDFKYPILLIVVFSALVFFVKRSFFVSLLSLVGFGVILNLGYWRETLETLILILFATGLSVGVGVPIGVLCAHYPRFYRIIAPVLDMMQTIPTFVYLIPTLMLFGLGMAPGLISTIIFVIPAPIRLTYAGISSVPKSLVEVADVYGSTKLQKLFKVELPYAFPTIRIGISQCMMLSLSMVVIAALVGADGLGKPVVQALNTVNIAKGFEAGLSIVIVAIILNKILQKAEI